MPLIEELLDKQIVEEDLLAKYDALKAKITSEQKTCKAGLDHFLVLMKNVPWGRYFSKREIEAMWSEALNNPNDNFILTRN